MRSQSGTGSPKVRIWNKTTGAGFGFDIATPSYRYGFAVDSAEYVNSVKAAPGDDIEFQIYESGGAASCVATAFLFYDWGQD